MLSTFSLVLVSGIVLFLIAFFGYALQLSFLGWFPQKLKTAFHYLRHRIYWCLPLRILMQSYMSVTMSAFLNLKYQDNTDSLEQTVNRALAWAFLLLFSIGFPVFMIIYLKKKFWTLGNPDFAKKYDSIYLSLDPTKHKGVYMHAFSIIRKFSLIFIAVIFNISTLQLAGSLVLQQCFTFYVLDVRPMQDLFRQRVEFFNETMLLLFALMNCTLTDYVPSTKIRYDIGWVLIYMIFAQVFVNAFFLGVSVYRQLKRI